MTNSLILNEEIKLLLTTIALLDQCLSVSHHSCHVLHAHSSMLWMCCSNESQYLLCSSSGVTDHINVVFMTEVLKLFGLLLLLLFVDKQNTSI